MTHASLFSGIGGFDLAAEKAGFKNMFTCEMNPFCIEVLKQRIKVRNYENIKTTNFKEWEGKIDIITGGFPCQPFSIAGHRKGARDDRYLWPEMLRAVKEIKPSWIIGENVAGITSMVQPGEDISMEKHTDLFGENDYTVKKEYADYVIGTIYRDFEELGYTVQSFVIPACAVGAPHKRERIWIAAHSNKSRNESMPKREKLSNKFKITSDAKGAGIKGEHIKEQEKGEFNGQNSRNLLSGWESFPTVSPIYSRNDGIRSELLRRRIREDSMGLLSEEEIDEIFQRANNKLREEAVTAAGNAIVPQVAYQILKSIKEIKTKK